MSGLPSHLWIMGVVRRLMGEGRAAYIVQRGDADTGTLLVRVNLLNGQSRLLTRMRDLEGDLQWVPALGDDPVADPRADDYVGKARARDPDLWVVEIEEPSGDNPFDT